MQHHCWCSITAGAAPAPPSQAEGAQLITEVTFGGAQTTLKPNTQRNPWGALPEPGGSDTAPGAALGGLLQHRGQDALQLRKAGAQ